MSSSENPASAVHTKLDQTATDPHFKEEVDAINWILTEVRNGNALPVVEAEAVAHSLFVDMRLEGHAAAKMLPLGAMSDYHAVHALNVSMLSMTMAEYLGYDDDAVYSIGLAGLLHDIGMVRVPLELIAKSEQLEPDEREIIKQHPAEGARIIIEADAALDLAAVVAYEHHLRVDGSGYPALKFPRQGHRVSRLVQVCDTFHALGSPRPFRDPWPSDVIFSFLNQRAGSDFDPEMTNTLTAVLKAAKANAE